MESLTISDELNKALRAEYGTKATDAQWTIFIEFCKLRNLMPGRDVVLQIHSSAETDQATQQKIYVKKASYVTTIGALQTIAERSGAYKGRKPTMYAIIGADKQLVYREEPYVMEGEKFFGAKVIVMRADRPDTIFFARYDAYVATTRDNKPRDLWVKRGPEQTAKCGFAGALREAFPEDLAGLYANEEMQRVKDDDEERDEVKNYANVPMPTVASPTMSAAPAREEGSKPLAVLVDQTLPVPPELSAILAPESANADIATKSPSADTMTVDPATPTLEQRAALEALKKVPKEKLAAFDTIVPDAKATFHPDHLPEAPEVKHVPNAPAASAAPAAPSTIVESQSSQESAPSTTTPPSGSSKEPLDKVSRDKQYARATKFCADVLTPEPPAGGGMKASKGNTVTAKLKKFFLSQTTKGTDLAALTLEQWEMTWVVLDARLREYGAEKLVQYIESKI